MSEILFSVLESNPSSLSVSIKPGGPIMLDNLNSFDMLTNTASEDLGMELLLKKRKKVMIIDDDMDFRLFVSELLVDEGYSVTTAKDGEIGLNHLVHNNDRPDLILVDLMMPVKSGMEFRREQLKLEGLSNIPVMFLTGHGYVEGESCLLKPFDEREFKAAVRKHLEN